MPFGKAPTLVDSTWLSNHLNNPDVIVLDCRWRLNDPHFGANAYKTGHIPGARHVDLNRDLSGPPGHYGGRHPLPDPESFERTLSALGVRPDAHVVCYDDDAAGAARCWWCLSYYGHAQVSILDGGIALWTARGLTLSNQEEPPAQPHSLPFVASPDPRMTVGYETLRVAGSRLTLIDARNAERFQGQVEPVDPIGGHIPGAVNVPYSSLLDEHGQYRSQEDLQERLAPYLSLASAPVVYCGSGVTACVGAVALRQIGVAPLLYPGSWSDWIQHQGAPIASSSQGS